MRLTKSLSLKHTFRAALTFYILKASFYRRLGFAQHLMFDSTLKKGFQEEREGHYDKSTI
ncbi:hypothetical protein ELAC_1523 [Estrella lausannensis]|uniref:Uncharacterized protein n=1 Tax=Estrella lausannensis TaxID=483423 RepID=A0A0H5DQD0_9BACT|nr:hypothetical protein ELAC_1523 [Estrella lausannensis]